MRRLSAKLTGDRVQKSGSFSSPESRASARSPVFYSPALESAIESAWFSERADDEDGPRIAVHCPALGGGFIYDAEEVERRIQKHFPHCGPDVVQMAVKHMRSRVQLFFSTQPSQKSQSWVRGWLDQ